MIPQEQHLQHILDLKRENKVEYNRTRPHKHGKQF